MDDYSNMTGGPGPDGRPAGLQRSLVYRWLSGLFARELEPETLEAYQTAEGAALLDALETEPALQPLAAALRGLAADPQGRATRLLDLRAAYARLFLGAGGVRSAPPYHSAYASEKGLLYQDQMVEMADLLAGLDMSVITDMKEPPDHIAIQLNVLAELADRSAHHAGTGSPPVRAQASRQQAAFIERHMLSWLPAFRDDCTAYDTSRFYALAASAATEYLKQDLARLSNVSSA